MILHSIDGAKTLKHCYSCGKPHNDPDPRYCGGCLGIKTRRSQTHDPYLGVYFTKQLTAALRPTDLINYTSKEQLRIMDGFLHHRPNTREELAAIRSAPPVPRGLLRDWYFEPHQEELELFRSWFSSLSPMDLIELTIKNNPPTIEAFRLAQKMWVTHRFLPMTYSEQHAYFPNSKAA